MRYHVTFKRPAINSPILDEGIETSVWETEAPDPVRAVEQTKHRNAENNGDGWILYEIMSMPKDPIPKSTYIIIALAGMQVVELIAWLLFR
jgi:hypothetical protein